MQYDYCNNTKRIRARFKIHGYWQKKLIDRALILYLESIRQWSDLFKEFDAWDKLSDEALLKFEKNFQHDKR